MFLASFSLLAQFSRAASAEGNLETNVQEAVVNYNIGKFDTSLAALKRLVKKIREPSLRGQAYLYLGLNYGVTKKQKRAEAAFRKALLANPALKLDPSRTKESVLALFEKVREGLLGEIEISSDREGARVTIDGKDVGKAPLQHTLKVGKHLVEVNSADGQYSWQTIVLVADKSTATLKATLEYQGGWLLVTSTPPGADVYVGEKKLGKTPLQKTMLPTGTVQISLELKGHKKREKPVTIAKGSVSTLDETLALLPVVQASARPTKRPTAKPAENKTPAKKPRLWTWVAAGSSLAVLGVGIGFGVVSRSTFKDYQASTTGEDYDRLRAKVKQQSTIANVSFGVAGALAVTAVVLFFVEGKTEQKTKAAVNWQPVVGFGQAGVQGRF